MTDGPQQIAPEALISGQPPVVDRFVAKISVEGRTVTTCIQPSAQIGRAVLHMLQQHV
ncbi:hypothetical protein [Rhodococcus jostii]|uniref:hypothetical protein n=1 Tax=Rhodococcus jostii TaxID=132919 RepID=UPI0013C356AA|nr:hypothetical protein [Rhodococcus jostii]